MRYIYRAADENGRIAEGSIDAMDTGEVLDFLIRRNWKPISITPEKIIETRKRGFFRENITVTDKIFLTKYLSLMLKSGTDLFKAINILIANFDKPIMKSFLLEVRANLEKGRPFYQSFAAYPQYFSPVFVNLVKAGEASGNLKEIFENLSLDLEKEHELRSKIRSALIYPIILFILSLSILFFLVLFALPRIANIFQGGDFQLPLFSKIVFTVGGFLGGNILIIAFVFFALIFGGWFFAAKTVSGKKFTADVLNAVPVIRSVVYKVSIQRFAATLSSLLKAGLPILDALNITAEAVGHPQIKEAIQRVSREGVTRGLTLGEAFGKEKVFPPVVTNLVAISEKAGHLDKVLKTLADFYDSEISFAVKNLVAFIEPVLLLIIGGIIGLIALSVLVPIYQLVTQF